MFTTGLVGFVVCLRIYILCRSDILKTREQIVKNCFNSWINKDISTFESIFSQDALYMESWGPAYRNRANIVKWFDDWTGKNSVLQWDILSFINQKDISVCEWYFKCDCNGKVDEFDGVSIIHFDEKNKIKYIKEFQSKIPNYYP